MGGRGEKGDRETYKGKGHTLILQNTIQSEQKPGNKEEEEPVL